MLVLRLPESVCQIILYSTSIYQKYPVYLQHLKVCKENITVSYFSALIKEYI